MSYSTMLYAVDIGELKSAFGSKDAALLARALAAYEKHEGSGAKAGRTSGPRVRVTWKSEIYLNGQLVTCDEFKEALLNPDWEQTWLFLYQEDPPPGQKREGRFKELGSFMSFILLDVAPHFQSRGLLLKKHYAIDHCSTEKDFANLGDPDDDITEERAIEELIAGKITQRENAPTYGYALECLCDTIGTFLDAVGTDQLRSLQLKTPLSKTRLPVKLPRCDDFPYISYLDADELRKELARLRGMDLTCPEDIEIEKERKRFLELLEIAAGKGHGVVGFYH